MSDADDSDVKQRRKAFADAFEALLERQFTDHNGIRLQGVEAVAAKVFQQAMGGDLSAVGFIKDLMQEDVSHQVGGPKDWC